MRDVVVTGVGAVTPLGNGAELSFDAWRSGTCGVADGVASCDDFRAEEILSVKEVRRTDRFTQLAIAAADEAVVAAGWGANGASASPPYDPHRVASVIGTGTGGISTFSKQYDVFLAKGPKGVWPLTVPVLMGNAAPGMLAIRYGLHGYSTAVMSACASGADAIAAGVRLIRTGESDAVLAGGSEAALNPLVIAAFGAMMATSKVGVSRPFDARRDGFVMGEGAGVMVLEDKELAERRGAPVIANLPGIGVTCDAYHLTAPEPDGRLAAKAIDLALTDAGLTPRDVDYVNAHGTSTQMNDRSETQALKAAFGARAYEIPVSSTKSSIGHLIGAAGAVEAIMTVFSLRDGVAPPTLGYEEPEEGLDLDYVAGSQRPLEAQPGRPMVGISNSFGFGGHNVVLAFEQQAAATAAAGHA